MGPWPEKGFAARTADLERRPLQKGRKTAISVLCIRARMRRAGQNCNAIILELPLAFLTDRPAEHRIVNAWGESWVLKAAHKVEVDPRRSPLDRASACLIGCAHSRRRTEEIQAGRYRRPGFRRRGTQRARRQPPTGREQFLAGAAFHQAARSSRLGVWPVDHRARARQRLRPRQFSGLGLSDLRAGGRGLSARQKDPVSGAQHAGRFVEPERIADTAAAPGRHFHPQCQLDRHGYDRHLAVRPAPGGPGGDPFPVDLSGHEREPQRQEISCRAAERPGPVEQPPRSSRRRRPTR